VTNETRYLSADDPLGQPTLVLPRTQDVEYGERWHSIHFVLHTLHTHTTVLG
jgi:protease II